MFFNVCFFVFLASFQLTQAIIGSNFEAVLRNSNEQCLAEAGITREDLLLYMEKPRYSDFFEDNRSCYVLCIGKELGKLTKDGKIDLLAAEGDVAKGSYDAALLPLLTTCAKEEGANPCETTKKNLQCLLNEMQKLTIEFDLDSLMQ